MSETESVPENQQDIATPVPQGVENGKCPICMTPNINLYPFECCARCKKSLKVTRNYNLEEIQQEMSRPLVSSSVLEEASLAIANSNPDEVGCTFKRKQKAMNRYYTSLNSWIDRMSDLNEVTEEELIHKDKNEASFGIRCATYCSFGINFILLVGKAIALSGSVSYTIISSLADSALDLIAGTIISCTAAHSKFTLDDLGKYPVGKSRVSTVGILVFSVLMSCCALYIILQCVISLSSHEISGEATLLAMIIMGATIVIKLIMCIVYYCLGHPITKTLAEDHRNDVLTNALGLFMYWGSSNIGWWMDSAGGIILSLFILVSWVMNAVENAKMLLGASAPPDIIRELTYVAAHHHPLIIEVEQVIAFQVGPQYFTELHIVVPGHIPLEVAHWIGESLQLKIERIPDIERAWVHVDCETHNENEHILLMRANGKLKSTPNKKGKRPSDADSVASNSNTDEEEVYDVP
ncbi:cation efflux family protein [Tritrichomonas foetus]|uniref:Cation efflux family protein n=1 Tax=Tritrichomonas foetus TaxID=1144522 RepID=A0A1J4JL51_9EUKA|nr:cation efflux family protein [Tritrichomonas foetus]|eukprot:OHS98285.1 cation efflux family protein [Tritrichomonas foetus]